MKERKSGLRNESSTTKRARLFHRNTAAYIYKKIIKKKKKKNYCSFCIPFDYHI